ncbi:diguanylate cyclase, partial [Parasphingorhabdus sp.]
MREQGILILLILGLTLPIFLLVLKRKDGQSQLSRSLSTQSAMAQSFSPAALERSHQPGGEIEITNDTGLVKMDSVLLADGIRKPEDDQKFQTLADMSPAGIFLTDSNGDCIYVNQSWLNLSGLQWEQAIGPGWADAIHPDDREQVWAEWDLAVTHERMFKMDFRFQQPSGKTIWIAVLCSPYRDQNGEIAGYVGVNFDITEQKALQMKLDMANRQFRHAENIAKIGSWRLTLENFKLEWSEQIFKMHQLPIGAVPDFDRILSYYPGEAATELYSALQLAIGECELFDIETDFITENGVRKRVRNIGEPEFKNGEIIGLVGVVQDVTDQSRLREKLRNVARLDELTEIANRKEHNETLETLLGQESCPVDPVALFLIDLDNFKTINDNLGHPAGDELLIQVAQRLANIPDINLVSRIGGDEFAIIKQQRLNDPDFQKTARQLEGCFDDDFLIEGQRIDASASFGAAISSDQAPCSETLVKSADIALYVAKDSGSKDCRFYDQKLGELYHRSGKLRLDLKTALKNDQLRLCYQPIVSLERQKVVSFEALLRWNHPELGEIAPDEFIPLMEQANLIVSIGDWVILEACR